MTWQITEFNNFAFYISQLLYTLIYAFYILIYLLKLYVLVLNVIYFKIKYQKFIMESNNPFPILPDFHFCISEYFT